MHYIAAGESGLRIVDVSNPAHLTEAGSYLAPMEAESVVVAGNYAYIADGEGSLRILNIANPAHPTETGFYSVMSGGAEGVAVVGNYAYVAAVEAGLRIVDISNPAAPSEVGFYDTPGAALGVAVAGKYAYVADWEEGLRVINISNSAAPTEVGFYDTPGIAHEVAVEGHYAHVADGEAGLRIVDISDPAHPTEVGFYDTPMRANSVAVSGNYVFVADGEGGLFILRFVGAGQGSLPTPPPQPVLTPQPLPSRLRTTRLTTNPANDIQPAWSPDGRTIVFVSDRLGGKDGYDLFAINPDGTDERLLAQFTVTDPWGGRFGQPGWLGGDLLVMDHKYFWEIMRFSLNKATLDNALPVRRDIWDGDSQYLTRLLFVPGGQGASSPISLDGSQIAWAAMTDIWDRVPPERWRHQVRIYYGGLETFVGNTDSAGTVVFEAEPGGFIEEYGSIAFSPDGKKLLISACVRGWTEGKGRDLYLVDLTTRKAQRLTSTGEEGYDNTGVAWSAQNVIIFASGKRNGGNYDLFVMYPDGSGFTRLTDTPWNEIQPSWSPDGTRFVFASDKEGNYDLYIGEFAR